MSFVSSDDELGTGFGNTNDAIVPAEYLGEPHQHYQYDEDSVMDPPSQIQIPSTDVTCASSVTTHFQDADLFVPHMYPSAQNLDDTPDIPDPTFQPKQQTRETIEPSLPALKEEASVNPADNMTVEGTSAGSTVMDEKRLLKEQEKLSMAMPVGGPSVMNLEAKINQKTQIYSIQHTPTDTTEKNCKSNYIHSSNDAELEKARIMSEFSAIGESENRYTTNDPNCALEKHQNPIISDLLEPTIKDSEIAVSTPPQQPTDRQPIVPPNNNNNNNSGTVILPGAIAISRRILQNGSQQPPPLDSVDDNSDNADDEEAQQRATHQHQDTLLAEATPVANTAENLPVATAAGEGNQKKKRITDKEYWQLHLMAVLLCIFILVGIVVGAVCGAGHCQSKVYVDSSSSTMTTRDVIAAPQIEIVLTSLFGKDYFNQVEEAEFGTDTKLGEFLLETRQRAFDWIVNQDRLQLEYDAKNLVQRFLLVLFYYQTTRQRPWKECNPPQKGSSSSANFCYEFDFVTGEITSDIWGSLWLSESHECQWAGVTCVTGQSNEKRVTELKIWWNGLSGPLPWEITQLQLKALDLRKSELTGTLPSKLLSSQNSLTLEGLYLVGGKLSGPIPKEWFLNQKEGNGNLKHLLLGGNRLTGTIPSELGLLSLEGQLGLNTNALTGTIPTEIFYSSSSLSMLLLHKNGLTGTVPTEVGLLTNLMTLTLYDTGLSGSIPSEIGLESSLVELHISNTNLQGTLPEELFGGLTNLRYLIANDCELSGAISSSIVLLTYLHQLHIANNKFHGTIPDEIGELTALVKLQVNGNDLTGSVPISFCQGLFHLNTNQLEVVADCLPDVDTGIAEVDCATGCCTSCCDENGICHAT